MPRLSLLGLLLVLGLAGLSGAQPATKFELSADEKAILDLTNAARAKEKLAPLLANPTLTRSAREHSFNMLKQNKMAHDLDGKSPFDRLRELNYQFRRAGENVAMGDGPVPIPQIFEGWMNSPGHRANILQSDYTEIGIGVAGMNGGRRYYTQVFGRPLQP